MMQEIFLQALREKRKIKVSFYSQEDGRVLVRTCAPMDYGPSRRTAVKNDRFHLWDYDSDTKEHVLSLNPGQVQDIEILNEHFEPAEFVTWKTSWFVPRDWGTYS